MHEDIANEFEQECEKELLLQQRENLFMIVKETVERKLREEGYLDEKQTTNLELLKKTNKCLEITLARDMIQMYEYITNMSNSFPKDVVTKQSRYVDIVSFDEETNLGKLEKPIMGKLKLLEFANELRDMKSIIDDLSNKRSEDNKSIVMLKQEVVQLQGQINTLKTGQSSIDTVSEIHSTQDKEGAVSAKSVVHNSHPNDQNNPIIIEVASTVSSRGSDPTIANQTSPQVHTPFINTTKTTQTSPGQRRRSASVTHIPNGDGKTTVISKSPLNIDQAQQVLQGREPSLKERTNTVQPSHQGRALKGIHREKGTAIFVRQIAIDGTEEDYEIGQTIKDYCETKGIRVMQHRIFRFRTVCDTVSCRIIIPESQEHKALDPSTWPEMIEVRRWKSKEDWDKERPSYRKYGNNWDNETYGRRW